MDDYENVKKLLDKYGDDIYRFAFVLTCSDKGASALLCEAVSVLSGEDKFTKNITENRNLLFSALVEYAPKHAGIFDSKQIKDKYGEKDETFYDLLKAPIAEKAFTHLTLYEDLTEKEAREIIKRK